MLSLSDTHFSFRLRLTVEADRDDPQSPPLVRGMVQHLGSDQVRYFSSLDGLPKILEKLIEESISITRRKE